MAPLKSFCAIALWACLSACTAAVQTGTGTASGGSPSDGFELVVLGTSPGAVGAGTLSASGGQRLRVISTNDFHGALESRPDANGVQRGGAALVAAVIERARSECDTGCESILVDAGDMFQGTVISNLAYGRPVVDYYNRMGYDAAALGNHEFDWGTDTLRARMRQAKYPMLGANVRLTDGGDADWIPDDTIIVRGTIRVGVVGISTQETATATMASNVRGLRFDDPAPVIDAHARALRARGADVVIVLAHEGGSCNAGATESCDGEIFSIASRITEKVDAIVSGHTHSLLDTYVSGIPIVQARSSGQAVAVLDIPLSGGKPAGRGVAEVRPVRATSVAPFAPVDSMVRRAAAHVAPLANRRVGTLRTPLTRSGDQYPLGNLVADANRWAGKGDIAIMNNGGIRTGLRAGPVTYGALFEVQPFANTLYNIRMTGTQLREYLERLVADDEPDIHVSGVTIGYNPELPKGRRIVSLRLPAGRTLADGAFYNVTVNSFMATGGNNMGPPAGTSSKPLNIVDLDALIGYVRTLPSPIRASEETRVFITQ